MLATYTNVYSQGYYFFNINTGELLNLTDNLNNLEDEIQQYIRAELDSDLVPTYSHMMDIIQKKFGKIYIVYRDENGNTENINVMKIANDLFKICFTHYCVNFAPNECVVLNELQPLNIQETRIVCMLDELISIGDQEWLKKNIENYSVIKTFVSGFNNHPVTINALILNSQEDLNYIKLCSKNTNIYHTIYLKDIIQKLIRYGYSESRIA